MTPTAARSASRAASSPRGRARRSAGRSATSSRRRRCSPRQPVGRRAPAHRDRPRAAAPPSAAPARRGGLPARRRERDGAPRHRRPSGGKPRRAGDRPPALDRGLGAADRRVGGRPGARHRRARRAGAGRRPVRRARGHAVHGSLTRVRPAAVARSGSAWWARSGVGVRDKVAPMGERTSHTPGTFSWTDLATTDTEGAKRFYTGLFGWEIDDRPIPGNGVYTMLLRDGKAVAALFQGQEGMPTAWSSYVTVESADAAAAKASDLGATPMGEPFDVMDAGRMAVIQDPTGAVVSVWEPHGSIGAQFVNGPGALTLNQLNTSDPEAAQRFYEGLFGWRTEAMPGGDQPYWGIYHGDRVNALSAGGSDACPPPPLALAQPQPGDHARVVGRPKAVRRTVAELVAHHLA